MDATTGAGRSAEQRALDALRAAGLVLVARNFRTRRGEIDLVMRDGPTLVFVEVRLRSSIRHGGALASVDAAKCRRLRAAAGTFMACHPALANTPPRFDVVAFDGPEAQPRWICAAFT